MKLLNSTKKKIAAAGIAVVVAASAGVAGAYWTSTGNGSGTATTGTEVDYTVTVDSVDLDNLSPAGPTQTVAYHVKNTNTGNQQVAQAVISVANADGTTWDGPGTCSAADFSISGATAGAPYTDTSGYPDNLSFDETHDDSFTIQMVETNADQDDCQGIAVPLYVDVT